MSLSEPGFAVGSRLNIRRTQLFPLSTTVMHQSLPLQKLLLIELIAPRFFEKRTSVLVVLSTKPASVALPRAVATMHSGAFGREAAAQV